MDKAVSGDAAALTPSNYTFLFLNDDDIRGSRVPYYWIEAETMRQKGFGALVDEVPESGDTILVLGCPSVRKTALRP